MQVNNAVQNRLRRATVEAFADAQAKKEYFEAYAKEKNKVKRIEMLREAIKEGWL